MGGAATAAPWERSQDTVEVSHLRRDAAMWKECRVDVTTHHAARGPRAWDPEIVVSACAEFPTARIMGLRPGRCLLRGFRGPVLVCYARCRHRADWGVILGRRHEYFVLVVVALTRAAPFCLVARPRGLRYGGRLGMGSPRSEAAVLHGRGTALADFGG